MDIANQHFQPCNETPVEITEFLLNDSIMIVVRFNYQIRKRPVRITASFESIVISHHDIATSQLSGLFSVS